MFQGLGYRGPDLEVGGAHILAPCRDTIGDMSYVPY